MAIDTPATIAILGAGPIGLEAALYARFLGYSVVIYEQGEVAEHVRRWGHVRLFSPFGSNRSSLGLAALAAQEETYQSPEEEALLTGAQWRERYLLPLSRTDLLIEELKLYTTVVGVSKGELWKSDLAGDPDRGDWPFRILSQDASGNEHVDEVDAVIDATGRCSQPNWLGEGGLPAIGERALRSRINYQLPDILGAERARYAGKQTVVVGSGHAAATSVVSLAQLAKEATGTYVTWLTRKTSAPTGPIKRFENDALPARDELAAAANTLATSGAVAWRPGVWMERVALENHWQLQLAGASTETLACDELIANIGQRADHSLSTELQLSHCQNTDRPVAAALQTTEPNYYVLGAKSAGRTCHFQFTDGLDQIRSLFQILGDRPTLDLYGNAVRIE